MGRRDQAQIADGKWKKTNHLQSQDEFDSLGESPQGGKPERLSDGRRKANRGKRSGLQNQDKFDSLGELAK
jgi:plasmid stabilization system protein ParE